MDVASAKQRVRDAVLTVREAMTEADRRTAGAALAAHGTQLWHGADQVAAYLSIGTEPATRPLLDALVAGGTRVVVPIVVGDGLDWAAYQPDAETSVGALGVAEPTGSRLGANALATVDVILVPALSVDRTGNRLGRGRGYYDRALRAVSAPVVAVVYDEELVASLPVEQHDRRVDAVLRPVGYLSLATR